MSEEQEILVKLALLEQVNDQQSKQFEDVNETLKEIVLLINNSNEERKDDFFILKGSFKRKVNSSISELKDYHDKDLKPLKLFIWLGENKKVLYTIGILFLVLAAEKIPTIYTHILNKFGL